ncbi:MAG TPA: hypothetical protein VGE07_21080 [Herpetosiphonaceae bacterium]
MVCLVLPLFVIVATMFGAARVGWRALRRWGETPAERRFGLAMLAVNLLEPAVNALLIPALLLRDQPWGLLAAVSAPMAVLLLPLPGLASSDRWTVNTCFWLTILGLARWQATLWTLAAGANAIWMALIGLALLWGCIGWAQGVLDDLGPSAERADWLERPVAAPLIDPAADAERL